jgi:hypothetical protein
VQACARLASSLRDYDAAVKAGVTLPWSAAPVEGQMNRLKMRHMLVPTACAGQLIGIDAAEERGEHEAEDFAEQLLLGTQAAFDLGDQVVGQAEPVEGLM